MVGIGVGEGEEEGPVGCVVRVCVCGVVGRCGRLVWVR